MTRRILAATDLSAPSRHAVDRAYRLAAERGWQLTLAHAIPPGIFDELQAMLGGNAPSIADSVAAEASRQLAALNDEPRRTHGVVADCRVLAGSPLAAITDFADRNGADLLVLGSRGEGFLRQMMLGSTASRLLRKTRHPVLVVKQPPHESYRRVLVAIDFSVASRAALQQVRKLAPEAQLVLLHVVELPFEGKMQYANVDEDIIRRYRQEAQARALGKLRQLMAEEGLPEPETRLVALPGLPAQLILQQEQEEDCDLIVVGKHGVNLVEELLLGSTTKHVLGESQGDVLVAN